jgi:rhomboid family GlyGly-CTERM serine protease
MYSATESNAASRWLLGLVAGIAVLLLLGGEAARLALRYDREAVLNAGQYWRLVSAHVVHGSGLHAGLNLLGLGLIAALFPRHYTAGQWLGIGVLSLATIDAGFLVLEPHLEWYVGLSGVLHGALAAGAFAWWAQEPKPLAAALTAVLAGKLAWEQSVGALPLAGGMPVIVDAHLYGAIGGMIAACGIHAGRRGWLKIVRPL